ncbi:hypothetical protein M2139_000464 [Enterococcus sp. PF1-24]|uniref:PucR family transcriptional regulator ligand-binding domain-containing protein n=1 Tax=unclassified Enterococcus TaxID=2608891 RepID=UPI0024768795|nr:MULTISPECIES: PucR family transcriptional regulator ligand-binding domain-containing protein [unclassified Enterococcus]MDH6363489.1 hypothetical protein [Enterococcus sp. PFB1-1]MDH6400583.1 hypothetical protein [Enterococcus sp. PF1-24]
MSDNSIQYVFNYEFKDVQVKDLVEAKQLVACESFATKQGFENKIKSATVMDVEDIEPWLHEGDVLFISRFMRTSFTNDFIQTLYEKKVSCIVTQKKFQVFVTGEQFDLLEKYHLPLIFVSDTSSWSDMIVTIQNLIIQNQTYYLVENQEFQKSIINYLSGNNSENSLCDIVHTLTGITIAITNRNLQVVDCSKDNAWEDELGELTKKSLNELLPIGKNFNDAIMRGHHFQPKNVAVCGQYFIIPDWLSRYGASFYIVVKTDDVSNSLPAQIVSRIETVESIYSLKHSDASIKIGTAKLREFSYT